MKNWRDHVNAEELRAPQPMLYKMHTRLEALENSVACKADGTTVDTVKAEMQQCTKLLDTKGSTEAHFMLVSNVREMDDNIDTKMKELERELAAVQDILRQNASGTPQTKCQYCNAEVDFDCIGKHETGCTKRKTAEPFCKFSHLLRGNKDAGAVDGTATEEKGNYLHITGSLLSDIRVLADKTSTLEKELREKVEGTQTVARRTEEDLTQRLEHDITEINKRISAIPVPDTGPVDALCRDVHSLALKVSGIETTLCLKADRAEFARLRMQMPMRDAYPFDAGETRIESPIRRIESPVRQKESPARGTAQRTQPIGSDTQRTLLPVRDTPPRAALSHSASVPHLRRDTRRAYPAGGLLSKEVDAFLNNSDPHSPVTSPSRQKKLDRLAKMHALHAVQNVVTTRTPRGDWMVEVMERAREGIQHGNEKTLEEVYNSLCDDHDREWDGVDRLMFFRLLTKHNAELSEQQLDMLWKSSDRDGDGLLNLAEFEAAFSPDSVEDSVPFDSREVGRAMILQLEKVHD